MPISLASITGSVDGITPVYDPASRWCWWNIKEIFTGTHGYKRYVPKVGDYVEDTEDFVTYIVDSIDEVTLLATLIPITRPGSSGNISIVDRLVGVGPGTQVDTYRVYLDTSVTPHAFAVDTRLRVAGTMCSYCKIFKGSTLSADGEVVAFLYDQNGVYLTDNIPLELVAIDSHTVHSIKVVSLAYTNQQLADGEVVTAVFYTDDGHVVSKQQLLVENTSFIRSVNVSQKYVSHISLKSPFLSETDENTIEYPINVPLQAFNMIGVVHYSDGTKLEMPVDGVKFKILGLETYVATVVGQQVNLVLSYTLATNEVAYGAVSGDGKYVVAPYKLVTTTQVGAFTVKLFAYPQWVDNYTGYVLKWFMYNLDRDISFDVTPFVSYESGQYSFVGNIYGVNQTLRVRINLRDVSPIFSSYIHIQNMEILLKEPGMVRSTNWTIKFDPTQVNPYGTDLAVRATILSASSARLDLKTGCTNLNEWIERLYFNTKPLHDKNREIKAPTPNFFAIELGSSRYEFPTSTWNSPVVLSSPVEINDTLFIEWIHRSATGDILLGKSGLPIYEA